MPFAHIPAALSCGDLNLGVCGLGSWRVETLTGFPWGFSECLPTPTSLLLVGAWLLDPYSLWPLARQLAPPRTQGKGLK